MGRVHLIAAPTSVPLAFSKRPTVGQIDVWLAAPRPLTAVEEASCLATLSQDERERWRRFIMAKPRVQYLAAHVLLRRILSRYVAIRPDEWPLEVNAFGRPHVHPSVSGLHFNLSHTDGLVALAMAGEQEIGIDVENVNRAVDLDRLAASAFAGAEASAFADADAAEKREIFFWTLKEAYIKARGMGLSLGLDGYTFDLTSGEPTIRFDERCLDDPARWRFWRFRPTPAHALALAGPALMSNVRIAWTDAATA